MNGNTLNPFLIPAIVKNIAKVSTIKDQLELKILREVSTIYNNLITTKYFDCVARGIKIEFPVPGNHQGHGICLYSGDSIKTVCIVNDLNEENDHGHQCENRKTWDPTIAHIFRKMKLEFLPDSEFYGLNPRINGLNVIEIISELYPFIVKIILANYASTSRILRGNELASFFGNFEALKDVSIQLNSDYTQSALNELQIVTDRLEKRGVTVELRIKSVDILRLIIDQQTGHNRTNPQAVSLRFYISNYSKLKPLARLLENNGSRLTIPYFFLLIFLSHCDIGRTDPNRYIQSLSLLSPYVTILKVGECSLDIFTTIPWPNMTYLKFIKVKFQLPILRNFPKIQHLTLINLCGTEEEDALMLGTQRRGQRQNMELIFGGCLTLKEFKLITRIGSRFPLVIRDKELFSYLQELLPNTTIISEQEYFPDY